MKKTVRLAAFVLLCELVGLAATPFTIAAIPTWYATLAKPTLSPPNTVFGPVWTVLYALMGIAAFMVWERGVKKQKVRQALLLFSVQLGLNFLWSLLFFGLRSPLLALVDIVLLWFAIAYTITGFYKVSKTAAWLLLPYLAWVSFAAYLNYSIWVLNR